MSDKVSNERLCWSYASWHFLLGGLHVGGALPCLCPLTLLPCVSLLAAKCKTRLLLHFFCIVMAKGFSFNFDVLELDSFLFLNFIFNKSVIKRIDPSCLYECCPIRSMRRLFTLPLCTSLALVHAYVYACIVVKSFFILQ